MRKLITVVIGAAALVLVGTAVRANVIDPSVDAAHKSDAKLRTDVAGQVAKYTLCLVKAAATCEKKGTTSAVECHLNTGVVDYEPIPGKNTAKFVAAIAKCDGKLDLSKKGTDYVGIGCPGDCNSAAPGTQECADLAAFQATVTATTPSTTPKVQLGTLAAVIDAECGVDTGEPQNGPLRIACVADNRKALSKYAAGLFKCEGKCETDFKDKKGNGGPNNGPNCLSGVAGSDPNFEACASAALSKAGTLSPSVASVVVPVVRSVINTATQGLFDRFDPTTVDPAASPCGNCGNNSREGAEVCDGTSATACPGMCKPDCTCP